MLEFSNGKYIPKRKGDRLCDRPPTHTRLQSEVNLKSKFT